MATVTALDSARAIATEEAVIDSGALVAEDIVLTRADAGSITIEDIYAGLPNTVLKGQFVSRVLYSGGAYAARPSGVPAGMAEYVGPTEPTTWLSGDTWVSTA